VSNLFGVVYVMDEPSAGLHPADTQALLRALDSLKAAGNSVYVVEHELDVVRHADWIVDIGPGAGRDGGEVLYSGPREGLREVKRSATRRFLFEDEVPRSRVRRSARKWLRLRDVTRNNLNRVAVDIPLEVLTVVTGISGSGKSSLIAQALVEPAARDQRVAVVKCAFQRARLGEGEPSRGRKPQVDFAGAIGDCLDVAPVLAGRRPFPQLFGHQ
jgi:excinuclease ABC subunit A